MKGKFSASTLRIILIITLLLLMAGGVAGFIFIRALLVEKANSTATVSAEAATSQEKLQNLRRAQATLDENKDVVKKAESMIATTQQYMYQDQIIEALIRLGKSADVSITSISFASTTPVEAAVPAGANAASPTATTGAPSGVNLTQVDVTLATPIKYENLLRFIRYVEQNTMTMKISSLNISKGDNAPAGQTLVNCDALTIGVYTR